MISRLLFFICLCGAVTASFIPPHDPLLTTSARPLSMEEIKSQETQELIEQMFQIARGEREDTQKSVMVGLAAPQIGVMQQVILVDVGFDSAARSLGELKVFINPRILEKSDEIVIDQEGCFSVDGNVCGMVPRSKWVKIEALDREGIPFCAKYSDLTARIFQHEIDHLNGIRFPDRVGQSGILHWVEESDLPEYRKNYANWHKTISWEGWLAMKNGKPYGPSELTK